jgi:hypothetical protein
MFRDPLCNLLDQLNRHIKTFGFTSDFFGQYMGNMFFSMGASAIRIATGYADFCQRTFDKRSAVGQSFDCRIAASVQDVA